MRLAALREAIAARKALLDRLRPVGDAALRSWQKYQDIELTYTSNAIEGNTLTLRETSELIEHGITVGGKPLRDHLEAVDHHDAVQWMHGLAADSPIDEAVVRELHRRIVARSEPGIAGIYSPHRRRVAGSVAVFPNPLKVPELMAEFGAWLGELPETPQAAFDAHFRFAAIHPFSDGNGRTARLLMNLLLIRAGYVPVAIRPVDRAAYLDAMERGSVDEDLGPFHLLMHERLEATMAEYVEALS